MHARRAGVAHAGEEVFVFEGAGSYGWGVFQNVSVVHGYAGDETAASDGVR